MESSPEEEDFRVLVDQRLEMSQMCTYSPERQLYPVLQQKQCGQQVKGSETPSSMTFSFVYPPGVLSPALNMRRTWIC